MKVVLSTLLAITICSNSYADTTPNQIKAILQKYEVKKAKLEDEFDKKHKVIITETIRGLKKFQRKYSQANDFAIVAILEKEIETLTKLESKSKIHLATLEPISVTAFEPFKINRTTGRDYVLPTLSGNEFKNNYFVHAPSKLKYIIPKGAKSVSGFGCCPPENSKDGVYFIIEVDGKRHYKSGTIKGKRKLAKFNVKLPAGAKEILFITDDKKNNSADHSYWLDVTFSTK